MHVPARSVKAVLAGGMLALACVGTSPAAAQDAAPIVRGKYQASISLDADGDLRTYRLASTAPQRDASPGGGQITITETADHAAIRTGNVMFDGLYALALAEANQNCVSHISDGSYNHGQPIPIDAFQTGAFWKYVWTRDLSYSADLAMAQFDPQRAVNSLLFKSSALKDSVAGGDRDQIIQDTGSGGSYPVSSDRVVWALGAQQALNYLEPAARAAFLQRAFPILCGTIEQDRRLVFEPGTGLYRGEESFLDWREQTYPAWTRDNVLPIAMSKSLSVNALDYNLLKTAADWARQCNHPVLAAHYRAWADDLKTRINQNFFDPAAGLYCAYLLSDGVCDVRVQRYELLGQCLAILFDIADPRQAAAVLEHYPTGPFGPPVVWPQERAIPIYHNQAIWPFVTAYWVRAAQHIGDATVVDAGVNSLRDGAALNLSNMENYDLLSGSPKVTTGPRTGPVVDSRRQLWSVAGYLSMVQNVIFGADVDGEGIRFRPCITTAQRAAFAGDTIELRNFLYRGSRQHVRVHLPMRDDGKTAAGICQIIRVELNGAPADGGYSSAAALRADNLWDIFLGPPAAGALHVGARLLDLADDRAIFAPPQPQWTGAGVSIDNGHAVLTYQQASPGDDVMIRIYRDGQVCESNAAPTTWTDPQPATADSPVHSYAVAAVNRQSGNVSHLSPPRSSATAEQQQTIAAAQLHNSGGDLVDNDHFENWGKPADQITAGAVSVPRDGVYQVRVKFSNGNGPVNTGLCCGVKRLEVAEASGHLMGGGYAIMPQSGQWKRWDLSSPVLAKLKANQNYTIRLFQDEHCRNMSCLAGNQLYTGGVGGGEKSFDYVNIAGLNLEYLGPGENAGAAVSLQLPPPPPTGTALQNP
jgi:hypothetical protein